jgi:hypothetical protein
MEKIKDVLKYIKLYTNCNDHALKRIEVLLENFVEVREVVKVIEKKDVIYIAKKGNKANIKKWAEQWLIQNNITYKEVSKKSRASEVVTKRNKFCIDAFMEGYGYSEIARYLKKHHSTIIHCIHKIKRVKNEENV